MKAIMPVRSLTRSAKARAVRIGATALVRKMTAASSRLALAASWPSGGAMPALTKTRSKVLPSSRRRIAALPAGLIAPRGDDIPAAALQFRREPQPQPARRADDERPAVFGHGTLSL